MGSWISHPCSQPCPAALLHQSSLFRRGHKSLTFLFEQTVDTIASHCRSGNVFYSLKPEV